MHCKCFVLLWLRWPDWLIPEIYAVSSSGYWRCWTMEKWGSISNEHCCGESVQGLDFVLPLSQIWLKIQKWREEAYYVNKSTPSRTGRRRLSGYHSLVDLPYFLFPHLYEGYLDSQRLCPVIILLASMLVWERDGVNHPFKLYSLGAITDNLPDPESWMKGKGKKKVAFFKKRSFNNPFTFFLISHFLRNRLENVECLTVWDCVIMPNLKINFLEKPIRILYAASCLPQNWYKNLGDTHIYHVNSYRIKVKKMPIY